MVLRRFFLFFSLLVITPLYGKHINKGGANVICSYYDDLSIKDNCSNKKKKLGWVFARDEDGNKIKVMGQKDEGFFRVSTIIVNNKSLAQNYDSLIVFCENGLKYAKPNNFFHKHVLDAYKKSSRKSGLLPIVLDNSIKPNAIDRMVVFGDSLSDQGNLMHKLKVFPKKPYFAGRFSNGPNWLDYIKQMTSLPAKNFAIAGAVSAKAKRENKPKKFNKVKNALQNKISGTLIKQVDDYINNTAKEKISSPKSTLYVIWIGGNDYLNHLYDVGVNKFIEGKDQRNLQVISKTVDSIVSGIDMLYDAGARKFAIINLVDLGLIPAVSKLVNKNSLKNKSKKNVELSSSLTQISRQHNQYLSEKILDLNKQYADSLVVEVDIFSKVGEFLTDGEVISKLGLAQELFDEYNFLQNSVKISKLGFNGNIFKTRKKYFLSTQNLIFFDNVHPSTSAHKMLAYIFHEAINKHMDIPNVSMDKYIN